MIFQAARDANRQGIQNGGSVTEIQETTGIFSFLGLRKF